MKKDHNKLSSNKPKSIRSKVTEMDNYILYMNDELDGDEIRKLIFQIYQIDLHKVGVLQEQTNSIYYHNDFIEIWNRLMTWDGGYKSLEAMPKSEVMDRFLQSQKNSLTGRDVREAVKHIFGINLDGISKLDKSGISLYSKEQWMTKSENDKIVIQTSSDDAEVWIYPTEYYKLKTGKKEVPEALQHELISLAYIYDRENGSQYYRNESGESVSNAFKEQTIRRILKIFTAEA
ncbi:hypothetical protein ACE4RR_11530 [Alteribacillus sp. HJP-4]